MLVEKFVKLNIPHVCVKPALVHTRVYGAFSRGIKNFLLGEPALPVRIWVTSVQRGKFTFPAGSSAVVEF